MGPAGRLEWTARPQSFPTIVRVVAVDADYLDTMRLAVTAGRGLMPDRRFRAARRRRQRLDGAAAGRAGHRAGTPDPAALGPRPWCAGPSCDRGGHRGRPGHRCARAAAGSRSTCRWRAPPQTWPTLTLRTAAGCIEPVEADARRRADREREPAALPLVVLTLREAIARQMSPQRLGSAVLGGLGAIALLLTALSVFVLGEAMAAFRARELGVRAALGATGAGLIGLLLGETIRPVMVGIAAGIGISIAGARLVRAFVFQVEPARPGVPRCR